MMPPDEPTSPLTYLQWNWGEAYEITGAAGIGSPSAATTTGR